MHENALFNKFFLLHASAPYYPYIKPCSRILEYAPPVHESIRGQKLYNTNTEDYVLQDVRDKIKKLTYFVR